MNILVCNDDGIFSEGIYALANVLKKKYNVTIFAPDGNRSGFSRSISFHKEITVKKVDFEGGIDAYVTSGTPADATRFALTNFNKKFDLVICGINLGSNLGSDIFYSGTVNACFEANFLGYPAIAFSNTAFNNYNFNENAIFIENYIEKLINLANSSYTLNVNIPNCNYVDIKGVKLCKVGKCRYSDGYIQTENNKFKLIGELIPPTYKDRGTDIYYAFKNYVTISPVSHFVLDKKVYNKLKGVELK